MMVVLDKFPFNTVPWIAFGLLILIILEVFLTATDPFFRKFDLWLQKVMGIKEEEKP